MARPAPLVATSLSLAALWLAGCDRGTPTAAPPPPESVTPSSSTPAPPTAAAPAQAETAAAPAGDAAGTIAPEQTPAPAPRPLPANVSLPAGGSIQDSIPLPGGKHTVVALYPEESDHQALVAKFADEFAKHGWRPKGEPENRVNEAISADFENDTELLTVTAYLDPPKPGLKAMLQLRPKSRR